MTGVTELGYVRFGVSNLAEWKVFAKDILGLEVVESGEKSASLRMDYWHHRMILEADGSDDLLAAGLRVAGVEEFKAMQATLTENNISFEVGDEALCSQINAITLTISPMQPFHNCGWLIMIDNNTIQR